MPWKQTDSVFRVSPGFINQSLRKSPSVRPSVRLSVCDVTEETSHFLFPLNPKEVRDDLVVLRRNTELCLVLPSYSAHRKLTSGPAESATGLTIQKIHFILEAGSGGIVPYVTLNRRGPTFISHCIHFIHDNHFKGDFNCCTLLNPVSFSCAAGASRSPEANRWGNTWRTQMSGGSMFMLMSV